MNTYDVWFPCKFLLELTKNNCFVTYSVLINRVIYLVTKGQC